MRIAVANYLEGFARIANREGLEAHVSSVKCWRSSVDALRPMLRRTRNESDQYCSLAPNLAHVAERHRIAGGLWVSLDHLVGAAE